jgi:hypothetical protein
MACRGTGRVISNLGGSPSTIECPWCAGGGLRTPSIDAQARWVSAAGVDGGGELGAEGAGEAPSHDT